MSRYSWRRAVWGLLMLAIIIAAWAPFIALYRFFSHFTQLF